MQITLMMSSLGPSSSCQELAGSFNASCRRVSMGIGRENRILAKDPKLDRAS